MDIKECAAVVTGAASGMGAATARFLAARGAKVALLDMNLDGADVVAKEIGGLAVQCDVSDAGSAEAALDKAREAHGSSRICVQCAGIAPGAAIVGRDGVMPLERFKQVIDVNLIGTFNIMRLCAADMSRLSEVNETGERGVIINTASVAAFEGQVGQCAYSASKGGVVSMMLPAARELSRYGVRVVTIAPGLMETPMLAGMPQQLQESLAAQVPFPRRFGKPQEFASLVGHIVDNAMINGEVIRLDGAIRMQAR
ncbi:MAG: NAD(P)-dependent dehydrogenase (short-subunit alcohol dehydrogenase family) [Gammaproteobacteria bacterium]|jgi:NAD(P)-dependent dehydrogenase (short-subunit alcohol dehydrogenase family)